MLIHEVENMSAAELAEGQEQIAQELFECNNEGPELAQRYVQARLDAKRFDENQAKQAKTLDLLQIGLEAAKEQADAAELGSATARKETREWEQKFDQALKDIEASHAAHTSEVQNLRSEHEIIDAAARGGLQIKDREIAELSERCERLKAAALQNHAALSSVAKLSTDALAVVAVENADKGK